MDSKPTSYTNQFGSPMSWCAASPEVRLYQGSPMSWSPSSYLLGHPKPLSSINEDPLTTNYTCCGIDLQNVHAKLQHLEEVHFFVADSSVPLQSNDIDMEVVTNLDNAMHHNSSSDSSNLNDRAHPPKHPISPQPHQDSESHYSQEGLYAYTPFPGYYSPSLFRSQHYGPRGGEGLLVVDDEAYKGRMPAVHRPRGLVFATKPSIQGPSVPPPNNSTKLGLKDRERVGTTSLAIAPAPTSFSANANLSATSIPSRVPAHTPLPPDSLYLSKPFRCPKPNCTKSYKQANGLKYHMAHGTCDLAPPKNPELVKHILERKWRERETNTAVAEPSHNVSAPVPSDVHLPPTHPTSDSFLENLARLEYGDLGSITETELREAELEAERRQRPFACALGDCQRRYRHMNGLRYHYQHSGDHGAAGLALLAGGLHETQISTGSKPFASPSLHCTTIEEIKAVDDINLHENSYPDVRREKVAGQISLEPEGGMHEDKINGLVRRLMTVFEDIQQYKWLLGRRGEKAQKLLDVFQMLLDIPSLEAKVRRNLLVATQRLSKNAGLYPTCYNLENVETAGEYPVAAGSFADIYKGRFLGQVVCLNIMRIYQSSHIDSFLKKFSAEAILWGQLSHANLLPIYGLYRYAMSLCLVSPWMEHGDVSNFLREHPDANRALLVADVAYGVAYLHSNDIIHGDLKGANILVNGSRRACLADFGLSAVSDANILHWTSHSSVESKGGSVRWQAPELFDIDSDDVVYNSMASDVYALSCVTYEIFTGNIPFHETPRDSTVTLKVKSGAQPSRPPTSSSAWGPWRLTDSIWTLMQMCWSMEPGSRPTVHQFVAKYTSKIPMDDRPVGSEDVITPARFRDSVGRTDPPSLDDIEDILRVAAAHPEHSPQRHLESQC